MKKDWKNHEIGEATLLWLKILCKDGSGFYNPRIPPCSPAALNILKAKGFIKLVKPRYGGKIVVPTVDGRKFLDTK